MRRCYLVCYDIRDARRLRRVFQVVKGYGEHWQFSVFFCVLKAIERVRLERDLSREMNLAEDQAVIIDLGPDREAAKQAISVLGPALPQAPSRSLVI